MQDSKKIFEGDFAQMQDLFTQRHIKGHRQVSLDA